jgi:hypothetical protein
MEVSYNGATPKIMVCTGKFLENIHDLGVPPILGNLHIIMGGPKLGYTLICPRIKREKES